MSERGLILAKPQDPADIDTPSDGCSVFSNLNDSDRLAIKLQDGSVVQWGSPGIVGITTVSTDQTVDNSWNNTASRVTAPSTFTLSAGQTVGLRTTVYSNGGVNDIATFIPDTGVTVRKTDGTTSTSLVLNSGRAIIVLIATDEYMIFGDIEDGDIFSAIGGLVCKIDPNSADGDGCVMNGNNYAELTDLTGNGYSFFNAGSNQPERLASTIDGRDVMQMSTTSQGIEQANTDMLDLLSTQGCLVFMSRIVGGFNTAYYWYSDGSTGFYSRMSNTVDRTVVKWGTNAFGGGIGSDHDEWKLTYIWRNGTSVRWYDNNTFESSGYEGSTFSPANGLALGKHSALGTLTPNIQYAGPFLVYNKPLDSDERSLIYNSFKTLYPSAGL